MAYGQVIAVVRYLVSAEASDRRAVFEPREQRLDGRALGGTVEHGGRTRIHDLKRGEPFPFITGFGRRRG